VSLSIIGGVTAIIYSTHSVYAQFEPSYRYQLTKNEKQINLALDTLVELASLQGHESLQTVLENLRNAGNIQFYLLKAPDKMLVAKGLKEEEFKTLPKACGVQNSGSNDLQFSSVCPDGYFVLVGFRIGKEEFWGHYFGFIRLQLLKDIGFSILSIFLALFIAFSDNRKLRQRSETKGARRGNRSGILFSETRAIVEGLATYESSNERYQREISVLRLQVAPSIRRELAAGKTFPYSFRATMVRTDINDYTTMFKSAKKERFQVYIDEFFARCSEIISRYQGFVHQFVGDEIIFYFKEAPGENSNRMAVSVLQEISAAADAIHSRSRLEDIPFRIKSSMATSSLRIGSSIDPIQISGENLIDSVRYLSCLEGGEKFDNPIIYGQEAHESLQGMVRDINIGVRELKNMGAQNIYRMAQAPSLQVVLNDGTSLNQLAYYRSNEQIKELLRYCLRLLSMGREQHLRMGEVLKHLNTIFLNETPQEIADLYLELLQEMKRLFAVDQLESGAVVMSVGVNLAIRLIRPEKFTGALLKAFDDRIFLKDARLTATVVVVLAHIRPDVENVVTKSAEKSRHNRTEASALFKKSLTTFDVRTWKTTVGRPLKKMLTSRDESRQASGYFSLGEISLAMRAEDPLWFSSNEYLQRLLVGARKAACSRNAMVRRQALLALKKAGSDSAIEDLLSLKTLTDDVRAEIEQFLAENARLDYVQLRMDGILRVY
jgi:class 3 adenylate cyclase